MDLPTPLILWDTLKQKSKLRVWEVIRSKVETHISSSQPTLPLTSTCCHCSLSFTEARSSRSTSSIDVDVVPCPFRSLSLSVWTTGSTSSLLSLCFFFSFFLSNILVSMCTITHLLVITRLFVLFILFFLIPLSLS